MVCGLQVDAKAFELKLLADLGSFKTTTVEPETSLLNHIACIATRLPGNEDIGKRLRARLPTLDAAADILLADDIEAELGPEQYEGPEAERPSGLNQLVEDVEKELARHEEDLARREPCADADADRFAESMRGFLRSAKVDLRTLNERIGNMRDVVKLVSTYMCEVPETRGAYRDALSRVVVFGRVKQFAADFDTACTAANAMRNLARKQEAEKRSKEEAASRRAMAAKADDVELRKGQKPAEADPSAPAAAAAGSKVKKGKISEHSFGLNLAMLRKSMRIDDDASTVMSEWH